MIGKTSKSITIKWEAPLPEDDLARGIPIIRICNNVFKQPEFNAGDWVKITSLINNKSIYRIAVGCNHSVRGMTLNTAMLDFAGVVELGTMTLTDEETGKRTTRPESLTTSRTEEPSTVYAANWIIRPTSKLERIKAVCKHPDKGYQISMQVAFVSLLLGILGFIIGIASFVVSIIGLKQ